MPSWTHLIRFVAVEDSQVHLGQIVDTNRDVGRDSIDGHKIQAYLINGSIFNGEVTKNVLTVQQASDKRSSFDHHRLISGPQLLSPVSREDCNYIRCLGLNYMDHAKVLSSQLECSGAHR